MRGKILQAVPSVCAGTNPMDMIVYKEKEEKRTKRERGVATSHGGEVVGPVGESKKMVGVGEGPVGEVRGRRRRWRSDKGETERNEGGVVGVEALRWCEVNEKKRRRCSFLVDREVGGLRCGGDYGGL
ncbi:hypothetical protein HAX54_015120 [Datura stramonium]|uniref:Uncharacterized protein n=1 Tax=Datura stramonium TaxID=4076 RepID=A0ABS8TS40_DATST|nr:hypothetical protein [Datura stramonium]